MKVLFLSVATGQGHHQAAQAVLDFFKGNEDVECRFLDVFENTSPILSDSLQSGYLLTTKRVPKVYGTFYDIADHRDPTKVSGLGRLLQGLLNPKLEKYIKQYNPDVIVTTHVFSAIALSYLKKRYLYKAKSIAIVTDYTIHPFWEDTDLDYYILASDLLEYQALAKGLSKEKLLPFGIPIHSHFSEKLPKNEARKSLGLKEDTFTVLFMMGSMGFGTNALDTVENLLQMPEDFQLITVCGKNEKLKSQIDELERNKPLLNYGYTDAVATLMDAADCIITKPGGLSTSEAMAKELPMILSDPIPGQEDRNLEFFLNNGLAMALSDNFTVTEAVYQLLHHSFKLKSTVDNMKHVGKPHAVQDVGNFMLSLAEQNK